MSGDNHGREISLSVEETNALRAKLGLKPLKTGSESKAKGSSRQGDSLDPSSRTSGEPSASQEDEEAVSGKKASETAKSTREAQEADFRARKEAADLKRRKIARAVLTSGSTIAEQAAEDDLLDCVAWVARLRKHQTEKDALASQGKVDRVRYDDESESESEETPAALKELANALQEPQEDSAALRVAHAVQDLPEEGDVLTLRDAPILDEDGALREGEDVLESLSICEKKALEEARRRKKLAGRQNPYDAVEELESGERKDILSHYDEWELEEKTAKGFAPPSKDEQNGFLLRMIEEGQSLVAIDAAAEALAKCGSLKHDSLKAAPEETETPAFRKPRRTRTSNKRNTGRSFWLSLMGGQEDADEDGEVGDAAQEEAEKHFGSRDSKAPQPRDSQKEKVVSAMEDASADKKLRGADGTSSRVPEKKVEKTSKPEKTQEIERLVEDARVKAQRPLEHFFEEEAREAERLSRQIKKFEEAAAEGEDGRRLLPQQQTRLLLERQQKAAVDGIEAEGLLLTDTTEFCRSVLTPLEKAEEARERVFVGRRLATKAKAAGAGSSSSSSKTKVEDREGANDAEEGELPMEESAPESETESADEPEFLKEAPIGNSVTGALQYLQSKDFFSMDKIRSRRGRHLEQPLHKPIDSREVKLDYRDSFGNVLNAKEAFRQISWRFHGKYPSLNKQEKKLKKIELERRLQENPMDALPTLKALQRVQQGEGTAHLVLTGGALDK